MDVPVKNYSSGMRARLGFSIASAVHPEVLILDEVLSVGDAKFKKKSEARVMKMFEGDVSVLFVSHSLAQVKRICNKALILDHGKLVSFGDIEDVAPIYEEMIAADEESQNELEAARKKKRNIKRQARFKDGYLMMEKLNLSMEEVLDVLEIESEAVREKYIAGIEAYGESLKE